ncbi:MAG: ATP-binding cassette domain-containing protein [Gammaproteobacteria bacterium]|nr:ATP-binding cassette domain-containing protein [Gammaproteobacteria bacterium]
MVILKEVGKSISGQAILHSMDLSVQKGELIVIIGPSGSGKSTLLRLVAGLEELSAGQIWINGQNMHHVPPAKRDIAMVFQNYALYPHMSVFDNMAYGLKMRKQPADKIKQRVETVASSLGLVDLLHRKPQALSGGQQQRVAMGRALVRQPSLFLFDEPLSNLDFTLKGQLRLEIKQLHQATQTTSIYVTHDQVEAMTLATRILVLNQGRVEQFDTPAMLYHQPASLFVGTFMGLHSMNLLQGHVNLEQNCIDIFEDFKLPMPVLTKTVTSGEKVWVGIRPEDMRVAEVNEGGLVLKVNEVSVDDMGADLWVRVVTADFSIPLMLRLLDRDKKTASISAISFNQLKAHLFLTSSGERIGGWDDKEKK